MKIMVIDGNSVLNRAFYGIRPLTTKDGIFTNAVYGFLNILFRMKDNVRPDAIVAAFDLKAPTFRHKMYSEYKAGRHATPAELLSQFPIIKEILPKFGVQILEKEGYEADDILGTISKMAEVSGNKCYIVTGDRDSLQLVSDKTTVLLAATKAGRSVTIEYDLEKIHEEYAIEPENLIDVKALMGDSSDNIPGVAGIGQKTALDLIQKFKTVENIYENIDSLDVKESVRTKLKNGCENAQLSYQLGKICREVPIEYSLENIPESSVDPSALYSLFAKLEFYSFIERLGLQPAGTPVAEQNISDSAEIAVSFEPYENSDEEIYFAWEKTAEQFRACIFNNDTLYIANGVDNFNNIIKGKKVFTHNIKGLYATGIEISKVGFDVSLAAYLQNPSADVQDLDKICVAYGVFPPKFDSQSDDLIPLLQNGACIKKICGMLLSKIEGDGQNDLLYKIEIPLSKVLSSMEKEGFLIDAEGLREYGDAINRDIIRLQKEIFADVGYEFNLNSPKQLGEALFVKLGLTPKKKNKQNGFSTDATVLESIKDEHPAVGKLLEFRQLSKLKTTYVDGLLGQTEADGRIHSTFNQTETRTGRISSSEPNLQNIPVRKDLGRELRRFFVAKDGCVLCDADYSQIELRVLASIANDENMIDAFTKGTDIHTATASKVFNMPEEMVTPLMRSRAKTVNFGIVYGIGAYSLAKDLGITFVEAKRYIAGYMETYKGVSDYMERVVENARRDGFVSTLSGRKRLLPEINATSKLTRTFGERVARNMPIQGTAADIIKIAMINVYNALEKEGLKAKLILQIHDELIVETPLEEVETVKEILKREMENALAMKVPLTVDLNSGKTWYDSK